MAHPYRGKPAYTFWKRGVESCAAGDIDLVTHASFQISNRDQVATAGSCFAQHIGRTLAAEGFNYLVTEKGPATAGASDDGYGLFSARFGNVYTVRQLLQLFDRAYGLFQPHDVAWPIGDRFVDPFRPNVQSGGFASIPALEVDRASHFLAVREMFESCSVFIFTLGLTEGWISEADGAVYPLAPGVVGEPPEANRYAPCNFGVDAMMRDMGVFLGKLRAVNRGVRVLLTVSPVPLAATFEDRHVVVSATYSKSALRVVAEEISQRHDWVDYFPSYEMITANYTKGRFYDEDLRSVRPEGVAHVMDCFKRHYLTNATPVVNTGRPEEPAVEAGPLSAADLARYRALDAIVCDEDLIVSTA